MDLSPIEKSISATIGSVITSLFVTPFDVVKVRLQSQVRTKGAAIPTSYVFCNDFFDHVKPVSQYRAPNSGVIGALRSIVRIEGPLALWKGLSPTLVMAVPATTIYYVGYDQLRMQMQSNLPSYLTVFSPLLAGSLARILAATSISPLELLRTRLQASPHSLKDVFRELQALTHKEGLPVLWKGLAATLWRDVPFSAIYWMGYETFRSHLTAYFKNSSNNEQTLLLPFVSGASSGLIAAFLTTPFDVAKTLNQIDNENRHRRIYRQLLIIWENEGMAGLFKGLVPRMAKVAPACALMITSYEVGKSYFTNFHRHN